MRNKVLFIGSACVDVVIYVERLPKTAEDIHPKSQTMALGGCAANAVTSALKAGADAVLAAPVGTGLFGKMVEDELTARNIPVRIRSEQQNGCCCCFVEDGGERTFLSVHGAEYLFDREAMKPIDAEGPYAYTYVCGLEIEEPTGEALIEYLKSHPESTVMYCPGPRGTELIARNALVFALHPILHVNEDEVMRLACKYDPDAADPEEAARIMHRITENAVIVTLGKDGAFVIDRNGTEKRLPGVPAESVVNTNGAGDTHAGAFLAGMSLGETVFEAAAHANAAASEFVQANH